MSTWEVFGKKIAEEMAKEILFGSKSLEENSILKIIKEKEKECPTNSKNCEN